MFFDTNLNCLHCLHSVSLGWKEVKDDTFGNWPDWRCWYCHVAGTLSFPTAYHTLSKSKI